MKPTRLQLVLSRTRRRAQHIQLDAADLRTHCVSVRLSIDELALLDASRVLVKMQRGEFLRAAGLDELPPTIPQINREAWSDLSRCTANLNQIAKRLNSNDRADAAEACREVQELRKLLITTRESLS